MIQSRLCNLQDIGEITRRLKDRFNEHRRPVLNPTSNYIYTAVSEHFLSNNHSDTHMLLIPTEKLKNVLPVSSFPQKKIASNRENDHVSFN